MSADRTDPNVIGETESPDGARALLSSGLAAALVVAADGEVALRRETRGGSLEWGGVYAQGVRLTGPWTVEGCVEGVTYRLPETLRRLSVRRSRVTSLHAWGPVAVEQELFAMPSYPGVVRSLTLRSERPVSVTVISRWAPFLAPVLVEGIKPYEYRLKSDGGTVEILSHGHGLAFDAAPAPASWTINGAGWTGGPVAVEGASMAMTHELSVTPDAPARQTSVVWGGLEPTLERHRGLGGRVLGGDPGGQASEADRCWSEWTARTPSMSFPDDADLERAYALARGALRALYTEPEPDLKGLVAGYPWYSALWCRDLAWMLPAVLWLGDHEWARASIATVLRYQSNAHIPLLGAEPGELPMQVSPGPVFLFGTSDTTLYYPELVSRLRAHSGSLDPARAWWPHLLEILRWAEARTDPTTRLFVNGGEAEEIRDAGASLGKVHYGFDAVDTTIWDSTDRRAHAIDVQVLYERALRAMADLGPRLGLAEGTESWVGESERLAESIRTRYDWPEEGYLADTLARDGTPVRRVRPNALRVVSAGLLDMTRAKSVVERASREDLASPWGMRTLSNLDPAYDPQAYHDGQVWPIATAWAADAAYAIGDATRGYAFLRQVAARIVAEEGLANECYRGDAPTAFDSCFLLGFSVAPLLSLLFERLWGLRLDAAEPRLTVEPAFPPGWRSASLHGLAIASGRADLDWNEGVVTVGWSGPGTLSVVRGEASARVDPGARAVLSVGNRQP